MQTIHIVGTDGVGKSTIVEKLKTSYPNATYIREPSIEMKEKILSCDDPIEKVKLFVQDRKNIYRSIQKDQLIISDRSFICSMVYQSLELDAIMLPIDSIPLIFNANIQSGIPMPHKIIYLYCESYELHRRLSKRHNEETPTIDHLKKLQDRYKLVFALLNISPLVINTTSYSSNQCISMILPHLP